MTENTRRPERRRTINSKGEIVDAPYGPSRWASPKKYACAHGECAHPAATLKPAGAHPEDDETSAKAHNCCGAH